jgi:hypothetical protein
MTAHVVHDYIAGAVGGMYIFIKKKKGGTGKTAIKGVLSNINAKTHTSFELHLLPIFYRLFTSRRVGDLKRSGVAPWVNMNVL